VPPWLEAVLLGFIEGLTEFIPVSSTGHLLIVQHWLGHQQSDMFNVVIQCGAVLAVIPLFWGRFQMLSRWREPASREMIAKILLAFFITGVGGLILDKMNFKLPETVHPVAWALVGRGCALHRGREMAPRPHAQQRDYLGGRDCRGGWSAPRRRLPRSFAVGLDHSSRADARDESRRRH
jgi:undecaprenyl-diphosphatase